MEISISARLAGHLPRLRRPLGAQGLGNKPRQFFFTLLAHVLAKNSSHKSAIQARLIVALVHSALVTVTSHLSTPRSPSPLPSHQLSKFVEGLPPVVALHCMVMSSLCLPDLKMRNVKIKKVRGSWTEHARPG